MIKLYDKESHALIGEITEAQLQFLVAELEEESTKDQDYYLDADVIDWLAENGADATLLAWLRNALGTRADMEIRWERS
jgi:processive 1,2-diacylglycerol beta-glucosyltransferase